MSGDQERFALTAGHTIRDSDVGALEAAVAANPGDVESRLKLLGKYFIRHTPEDRVAHALWFIENHPGGDFARSPLCTFMDGEREGPGYVRLRDAWTSAIARHPETPDVFYNAAQFFTLQDPERCRELLEMGERLAPSWSAWARQLATNRFRTVEGARASAARGAAPEHAADELQSMAREALRHYERALSLAVDAKSRFQLLPHAADAAYEAGEPSVAVRYADETLALAQERTDERHRPDYVHEAHIVRGLVALDAEDVASAAHELHAAGAQGSKEAPVLRSFGPDLRLAQRLLARDESATVLAYLAQCATFWMPARVRRWIEVIGRGGVPKMFTGFDPSEYGFGPGAS